MTDGNFEIYTCFKQVLEFFNLRKSKQEDEKRKRVSICNEHAEKFRKLSLEKARGLAVKSERDPTHCVLCGKLLCHPKLRHREEINLVRKK